MKFVSFAFVTIPMFSSAFAFEQNGCQAARVPHRATRAKFRHPRHIADHGKFDEAEPERHLHFGRQRRQWRRAQGRMPDSSRGVRPLIKQNKPDKM